MTLSGSNIDLKNTLLAAVANAQKPVSSGDLSEWLHIAKSTTKRYIELLLREGLITRHGTGRGTRYSLVKQPEQPEITEKGGLQETDSQQLLRYLHSPLTVRKITGYDRSFVEKYIPNQTYLLSESLAVSLLKEGSMSGQQPAGTYARKVLEQLLIDLSWSSSHLEGNKYSLLATEELFKSGMEAGDMDAVMLLNHKQAIEFLVDAVPESGLTTSVISNLHAILMQDLLSDPEGLGTIRKKIVNISGTTYTPLQAPPLLQDMFGQIIEKACHIKNPVESAFFLWVNLAYLQPFEDGNKRTSRLAANIPLMIYNSAPLSFLDADLTEYAYAMMGVYEQQNVALAVELFERLYRRSIQRYKVTLESMGVPDPFRLRHRENLNTAIRSIVADRDSLQSVIETTNIPPFDIEQFRTLLVDELRVLNTHNCARYRLSLKLTEQWIKDGRPA